MYSIRQTSFLEREMRLILAFVASSLLSADLSHAQEPSALSAETLLQVADQARACRYEIQKVSLDKNGQAKGEWKKPNKGTGDALKKLFSGNEDYLRALKSLVGQTSVDPATGVPTRIKGELPEELPYLKGLFKLQKLNILMEQTLHGDKWLPSNFELEIKYWRMTILFMNVHDKYKATFNCAPEQLAGK